MVDSKQTRSSRMTIRRFLSVAKACEALETRCLLSGTAIANPSFEASSAWVATTSGAEFSQGYENTWASQGSQSYEFTRSAGFTSAGDYAEISQVGVDLTGVSGIQFDCRDTGIDMEPLQIMVDGQVMGQFTNDGWPVGQSVDLGNSANWGHTAITDGVQIPFTMAFSGSHTLTIRMFENSNFDPLDPKIFMIDNLRTFVSTVSDLDSGFAPSSGNIVPLLFTAEQVLQEPDGQILSVGHQGDISGGDSQGVLEQLNSDGTIDTSFGSNGTATTDSSNNDMFLNAAIESNGQIVAVGQSNGAFLVARYNSDGSLDNGFGNGGFATIQFGEGVSAVASSVAIESDGSIVVAGEAGNSFALARLTAAGALDPLFNPGGADEAAFPQGGQRTIAAASSGAVQQVLIESNGKILGVGSSGNAVMLFQLSADGTNDPSFGSSGIVLINQLSSVDPISQTAVTEGIALQPSGEILVAGENRTGGMAAVRLTSSGKTDSSFGVSGMISTSFGGSNDDLTGLASDSANGQFLLVGTSNAGGIVQVAIAAFNPDGTVNTSFANRGQFLLTVPGVLISTSSVAAAREPDSLIRPQAFHPQVSDFVFATIGANDKPLIGASGGSNASLTRLNPISPGTGFGRMGNKNVRPPIFTLTDGTTVIISASGGSGTVYHSANEIELDLSGAISLKIQTHGGNNSLELASLTSAGNLRGLDASTAKLTGTLSAPGKIGTLKLASISGIVIAGGISSLSVGDIDGSISCSGVLTNAKVGAVSGTIAAQSIHALNVASMSGATILAGANLGSDGQLGGSGSAADTYSAGQILELNVNGSIATSFIGAGADPVDGVLGDGDDISAGEGSLIRRITVKKGIDAATRFEATSLPKTVSLPAKTSTAANANFITLT